MSADEVLKELVYDVHVFCCINERPADHSRGSCAARGSVDLHKHMKIRTKELKIKGIRINKAGCLDRCELGPVLVIYPEAVWYRYETRQDIDDIIERHILGGEIVERLQLETRQKLPAPVAAPRLRLRVEWIKRLADRIKQVELVAEDGGELPSFTAGSHINVLIGNGLSRSYSLSNDPGQRRCYQIAVLRETAGRGGSAWIHDNLAIGDVIEATHPANNFPLDEDAAGHLLIAGGIGISPLLSMGRRLRRLGAPVMLHYCTRGPETTAYAQDVKEIFGDQVIFYHDGGYPERGIDLERVLAKPAAGTSLYICGPGDLIEAARKAASHWPEKSVRYEFFAAVAQDPAISNDDAAFDVILSRQGKTLTVPVGKSILEVVREAGVHVESSCEEGICGSCRVGLLGGKADHRDSVLDGEEKSKNTAIMICSSRAQAGQTLILDI